MFKTIVDAPRIVPCVNSSKGGFMIRSFNEGVPDLGEGDTLVVVTRIVLLEVVSFLFVYHRHCVILLCD